MDAGDALVEHLFREMQVDEVWAVRRERGFTWWAGALAQRIWAERPIEDAGVSLSRVHVQTDLLRGLDGRGQALDRLAVTTGFATMSGPLVGEGVVRLAASAYVHTETLEMWQHLLTAAALIQVAEAHASVQMLAGLVGAEAAVSEHPLSGLRLVQDDMVNVIRDVFSPLGQRPSMFVGDDFDEAERTVGRQLSVLTTASPTGLSSMLPCGDETALVYMRTDVANPQLGNGLMVTVSLPTIFRPEERGRVALDLNRRELSEFTRAPFLGSWCPHPTMRTTLTYVTFLPNACALPGLPSTLLAYARARVDWVERTLGLTGAEPKARPRSAFGRLFGRG